MAPLVAPMGEMVVVPNAGSPPAVVMVMVALATLAMEGRRVWMVVALSPQWRQTEEQEARA